MFGNVGRWVGSAGVLSAVAVVGFGERLWIVAMQLVGDVLASMLPSRDAVAAAALQSFWLINAKPRSFR